MNFLLINPVSQTVPKSIKTREDNHAYLNSSPSLIREVTKYFNHEEPSRLDLLFFVAQKNLSTGSIYPNTNNGGNSEDSSLSRENTEIKNVPQTRIITRASSKKRKNSDASMASENQAKKSQLSSTSTLLTGTSQSLPTALFSAKKFLSNSEIKQVNSLTLKISKNPKNLLLVGKLLKESELKVESKKYKIKTNEDIHDNNLLTLLAQIELHFETKLNELCIKGLCCTIAQLSSEKEGIIITYLDAAEILIQNIGCFPCFRDQIKFIVNEKEIVKIETGLRKILYNL